MKPEELARKNMRDVLRIVSHFGLTGFNGSLTLHFAEGQLKQEKVNVEASVRRFDGGRMRTDREMDKLIDCVLPLDTET